MKKVGIILLQKAINIIKRKNIKTQRQFLLFELSSFFCNNKKILKKLEPHEKVCKRIFDFCTIVALSSHYIHIHSYIYIYIYIYI